MVTTFFHFASTKTALQILFQYVHDFQDNLTTLYSKLVDDNDIDPKSYDVRQHVITFSALLKLCMDEVTDCKSQINQLTTQFKCILITLDETEDTNWKPTKRGIVHALFKANKFSSQDVFTMKINQHFTLLNIFMTEKYSGPSGDQTWCLSHSGWVP